MVMLHDGWAQGKIKVNGEGGKWENDTCVQRTSNYTIVLLDFFTRKLQRPSFAIHIISQLLTLQQTTNSTDHDNEVPDT